MHETARTLEQAKAEWLRAKAVLAEAGKRVREARAARDVEILRRYEQDPRSVADWCPEFGVRPQRVYQILDEMERKEAEALAASKAGKRVKAAGKQAAAPRAG